MKKPLAGLAVLGLVVGSALAQQPKTAPKTAAPAQPAGPGELKSTKQQASYGLGLSIGRNLKAQSIDVDLELLSRGLRDGVAGSEPLLTDEQIQNALRAFQQELMEKQAAITKAEAERNKKEGEAFLAANKKKEGVKTLPSGLQYKVIKEGTGPVPKAEDTVSTHYRGTLIDGTEFDSSYKRGEPATFGVSEVIKGWTEALQLMKVGSKWQLFIPAELAYGENPRPGSPIPPNATLLFDIELLGIGKPRPNP
jgi:FKBP-type peptidyl-prolyl cis-trans isomerase FklB